MSASSPCSTRTATCPATDQSDIQYEVNQLTQEIDRQRSSVQFNGINLLDGIAGGSAAS